MVTAGSIIVTRHVSSLGMGEWGRPEGAFGHVWMVAGPSQRLQKVDERILGKASRNSVLRVPVIESRQGLQQVDHLFAFLDTSTMCIVGDFSSEKNELSTCSPCPVKVFIPPPELLKVALPYSEAIISDICQALLPWSGYTAVASWFSLATSWYSRSDCLADLSTTSVTCASLPALYWHSVARCANVWGDFMLPRPATKTLPEHLLAHCEAVGSGWTLLDAKLLEKQTMLQSRRSRSRSGVKRTIAKGGSTGRTWGLLNEIAPHRLATLKQLIHNNGVWRETYPKPAGCQMVSVHDVKVEFSCGREQARKIIAACC